MGAANPMWVFGDVAAKAEALTQFDETAVRDVLLRNGDWDGGYGDLADPSAANVDRWLIRGDPAAGGLISDAAAARVRGAPRQRPGHDDRRERPTRRTAPTRWRRSRRSSGRSAADAIGDVLDTYGHWGYRHLVVEGR